jgi:deoxyribose-phosphate aldolase
MFNFSCITYLNGLLYSPAKPDDRSMPSFSVSLAEQALAVRLLSFLDFTRLNDRDTPVQVEAWATTAVTPWGSPAAICVYPEYVATVIRANLQSPIPVTTVVNFPDGGENARRTEREILLALSAGATEIDLVLPYRAILRGQPAMAVEVVRAARQACGTGILLKLILEVGELASPDLIRQASELGLAERADFLKTSTGKTECGATPQAVAVMLDAIADSGFACGLKVSGGIRTLADTQLYLRLVQERMGASWLAPARFRIGSSALFSEIVALLSNGSPMQTPCSGRLA